MLCLLTFMIYSRMLYKPFHILQTDQTLQNYIDMLSHLVVFLLHDKNNYFIPFPTFISTLIHDIQHLSSLTQLSPSVIQNNFDQYALKIVDLLIGIWTYIWDPSLGNLIGDPTMCFLALLIWQPLDTKFNSNISNKSLSKILSGNYKKTQQEVPTVLLPYLYYYMWSML